MANEYKYDRVLLKLSGEALAGDQGYGIDPRVVDDLAEEIAEIAKCRPSTVRSRLRRARAQLKTLIEQEESHEAVADGRVSCFDGGNREPEYGA